VCRFDQLCWLISPSFIASRDKKTKRFNQNFLKCMRSEKVTLSVFLNGFGGTTQLISIEHTRQFCMKPSKCPFRRHFCVWSPPSIFRPSSTCAGIDDDCNGTATLSRPLRKCHQWRMVWGIRRKLGCGQDVQRKTVYERICAGPSKRATVAPSLYQIG